jgi:hypothetical protein
MLRFEFAEYTTVVTISRTDLQQSVVGLVSCSNSGFCRIIVAIKASFTTLLQYFCPLELSTSRRLPDDLEENEPLVVEVQRINLN